MTSFAPASGSVFSLLPPDNATGNFRRSCSGCRCADLHLARLHEALNSAYRPALEGLDQLTSQFQGYGADAKAMAFKQLFRMVHREGVVMAFSDVFLGLTALFVVLGLGTLMMKKPPAPTGTAGAEH